jgi:hypothetical protein
MDEEIEAIDVARRAAASDVGESTIGSLEQAADDMALAYPRTSPGVLLRRARAHLHYATGLLDNRMTLAEHSRLLVTTGWLSLLTATCLIDLRRFPAAAAHLRTAAQLARETGQPEIAGWCLETKAWQEIISGDTSALPHWPRPRNGSRLSGAARTSRRPGRRPERSRGSARPAKPAPRWPGRRRSSPRYRSLTGPSITTRTTRPSSRHTPRLRSPGLATRRRLARAAGSVQLLARRRGHPHRRKSRRGGGRTARGVRRVLPSHSSRAASQARLPCPRPGLGCVRMRQDFLDRPYNVDLLGGRRVSDQAR